MVTRKFNVYLIIWHSLVFYFYQVEMTLCSIIFIFGRLRPEVPGKYNMYHFQFFLFEIRKCSIGYC